MGENTTRLDRYAHAILAAGHMPGTIPTAMLWASAVVAVADAEMAELRAELEGLRALRIEDYAALNETSAERDAAEAKVARVEALAEEWIADTGLVYGEDYGMQVRAALDGTNSASSA